MAATFETEVQLRGKTATFLVVPVDALAAISDRTRVPVRVTVNDRYAYRSTVAPMGGELLLPLNRRNRAAAGVAAGDTVTITLELDDEPRVVTPPPELAEALASDPEAAAAFDALSYTHQREYAEWVDEAKKPETRTRRAAKSLEMLLEGRTRG